jgi:hypothetical protein
MSHFKPITTVKEILELGDDHFENLLLINLDVEYLMWHVFPLVFWFGVLWLFVHHLTL